MPNLTKADLTWLLRFIENYDYVMDAYPELFKESDEDDLKVARQLIKEKLDE